MIKASITFLLLGLAVFGTAKPQRHRFIARRGQLQVSPAPTGYPEAGVTPEIPFGLPSSTAHPEVNYFQPDNTYGPPLSGDKQPQPDDVPEVEQAIETDDIPAEVEDSSRDEEQQRVPEVDDEEVLVQEANDGTTIAVSNTLDQIKVQRLAEIYQRFPQPRRSQQPVPERLLLRRSQFRNF